MFSVGRPDVFPVGDSGIRQGMCALCADLDGRVPTRRTPCRTCASRDPWRVEEDVAASVDEVREG